MRIDKRVIIGIFVLSVLFVPTALAKESYHFSSNNSAVLAQVWGKNITTAEYMEKVFPGSLKVLPKDIVESIQKEPMVWSTPNKAQSSNLTLTAIKSSKSDTVGGKVSPNGLFGDGNVYYVDCETYQMPDYEGQLGYYAYGKVTLPTTSSTVPEISIHSYVYKDGGSTPVATSCDWGLNTNEEVADGVLTLPYGYHNYYTSANFFVVWPIRSTPQTSTGVMTTATQRLLGY
jgi:hypothetical protein